MTGLLINCTPFNKVDPISGPKIGVLCLMGRGHQHEFCLVLSVVENEADA